ncbi:MAG TPA: polyprenyl synthetase family protein [Chloroflexota bacterium]|nr:polyprenyl synthetase family protein [Chloroflexota bacterium]
MPTFEFPPEIRQNLGLIEERFQSIVNSKVDLVEETSGYILSSPGKRLRPALVLLAADNQSAMMDKLILWGLTVELTHTASLVHDDLLDQAPLRRGLPTLNAKWGNNIALLVGDFFFAKVAATLAELDDSRLISLIAETIGSVCEGETWELLTARHADVSVDDYLRRIELKTATLLATSCQGGALLGGRPEAEVLAFRQFGHYIGLVFQVVDDILDITADEAKLGKAVGTDLRQGLATLPILYALNDGINPAPIVAVLEAKTDREEDVLEALELVRRSSAVDQAYTYAEQVNRQARECLTGIHSRYRDTLEALTENLLVRES